MCQKHRLLRVAVACATVVGLSVHADAAGLLIADGGLGGILEIREQNVGVVINNGVAVTEVEQVFLNTENRVVEALYTFPVPKGASVSNFSMWINGKEMIGEVVEKERARQIYESYKRTRRDPGLLEQVNYKTFEMRVFPIAAGTEQRVKVTYYQELDFDHDWSSYVYPLATVTRRDVDQRTTGRFAFTLDVKSEVPIHTMESPSHRDDFVLVKHSDNYYQASLEASGGDLSRDLVIAYKTERPRTGIDIVTSKVPGEDGYFMLTLTAGEELSERNRGMDYVFILDVSGSMANDGKLRLSRDSIFAFMDGLGEEDRMEVISFNISPQPLFRELRLVNGATKEQALSYLESQRARGGTVLRPAISAAYRYQDADRTLNVVVLSDGMTEQREQRELLQLIGERPAGSRVFCIGVGNEVNRPLLRQLAESAGGLAAFLSDEDNLERQATAFRRKLMRPAIRNVGITFSDESSYDVEPRELPDLFHGSPIRAYGRYRRGGPIAVTVKGEIQGSPFQQTIDVMLPDEDRANPQIERMWASRRVQRLLAAERADGQADRHQAEIVRLCEGYSIVSPYASFIVLENDAEYRRWKIQRRNAQRLARDRVARQQTQDELARLREQALAQLGPALDKSSTRPLDMSGAEAASPTRRLTTTAMPSHSADSNSTSRDLSVPRGGGGGGAMDPISGAIALALAGAAAAASRRRRRRSD